MDFTSLAKVTYSDQLILTTEQLAEFYGCETRNISDNFKNNEERFVENKHYFKLKGEELKNFRLQSETIGLQISAMTRTLYLWTKRGAARHAKMLSTDRAWEVFEQLEDTYFTVKEKIAALKIEKEAVPENPPSAFTPETAIKAIKDIVTGTQMLSQYLNMPKERAMSNVISLLEIAYGMDFNGFKETMPAVEKKKEKLFSPTQLGALTGKSAQYVNKRLCTLGFQKKDFRGGYLLTEKGREYGKLVSYYNNGNKYHQIRWDYCIRYII